MMQWKTLKRPKPQLSKLSKMSMEFNLRSGETYTLGQILQGKKQVFIPDMQRDYCWAYTRSETNGNSLVSNFVRDLKQQAQSKEPINMGLLYAYESPKHHIQLCDGQQRLTTLYLLFGEIFRKLTEGQRKKRVKDLLQVIGVNGQRLPRLQYAIRETTLSFLDDLVKEYLLEDSCSAEEITEQDWFFSEYSLDPSALNMLEAIKVIKNELSDFDQLEQLADLLLDRIEFLYFDMVNRTYGEEQFVVINTTGKPLTTSENIKPKLLGELDDHNVREEYDGKTALRYCADLWETWVDFFWQHSDDSGRVADNDLNEFFRWVYVLEKINRSDNEGAQATLQSAKHTILNLREDDKPESSVALINLIQDYFLAFETVSNDEEITKWLFKGEPLSQIQLFVLLPLLNFIKLFRSQITDRDYLRVKRYFQAKSKQSTVTKSIVDAVVAAARLPIVLHGYNERDIASITSMKEKISETILNECDRYKFNLAKAAEDREKVEESFWKAENLGISQGNIEYEFQILGIDFSEDINNFSLEQFDKLTAILQLTLESPNNLIRRTLLIFGDYTKWESYTYKLGANRYSLGSNIAFFKEILQNPSTTAAHRMQCLIDFLEALMLMANFDQENINQWCSDRIRKFHVEETTIWARTRSKLIKEPEWMDFMKLQNFCIKEDETEAYALRRQRVTGEDSYKVIVSLTT
jgi:hypothetical protein